MPPAMAGSLMTVAASDERARLLELLEVQNDGGPCRDCYRLGAMAVNVNARRRADALGAVHTRGDRGRVPVRERAAAEARSRCEKPVKIPQRMRSLPGVGPALLDPDRPADVARSCGRGARLMRSAIQGGLGLSSWRGCVFTRKVAIRTVALCVPLCVCEIASPLPRTSVVPDNHRSARWGVMTAHIRRVALLPARDERDILRRTRPERDGDTGAAGALPGSPSHARCSLYFP